MKPFPQLVGAAAAAMFLSGCATVSPDSGVGDVTRLAQGKAAGVQVRLAAAPSAQTQQAIAELLAKPLDDDAAVRIALLNNPGLHASLTTLGISDADRVQAGRPTNPHLGLGRFTEGDKVEIERILKFDVIGLLTLPWRAQWAGQQTELAKLQAAQDVVKLAADTRKAWINAVTAQQTARYMRDVKAASEAGAELARRLARVGNWSRLNQAREQSFLVDSTVMLARAEQTAFASREQLTQLMGLWGVQINYQLPDRLPELPSTVREMADVEEQAIGQRLDVRSAITEATYVADSLGLVKVSGMVDVLDVGYTRNTNFDNSAGTRETRRGWDLELPLPLFVWGQARSARAQGTYLQSVAKVREAGVRARSEAREAYHGYRTAYDLARYYRDELVPLRKFINDEVLLRYNGMIVGVFELLADARTNVQAINASIEAQRDFWLADTDLQTALTGTSPGSISPTQRASPAGGDAKQH